MDFLSGGSSETIQLEDMHPADVVVCLEDEEAPLTKLSRSAEGPQHLGLELKRLNGTDREDLRRLLQQAHKWLRETVGLRSPNEHHTPTGFAELQWRSRSKRRSSQPLPRSSAAVPLDGDTERAALVDDGDPIHDASDGQPTENTGTGRPPQRPAPGTLADYRAATKLLSDTRIQTHVKFNSTKRQLSYVGIRVKELSPSDASCRNPLADRYFDLVKVSEHSHHSLQDHYPADTATEIVVKVPSSASEVTFTVETSAPIDADYVEVEIVKRSPAKTAK